MAVTWMARRRWGLRLMHRLMMRPLVGTDAKGLSSDTIHIPSQSTPGHSIRARVYKPENAEGPLTAMFYAHGGGYQMGVPEQAHAFFQDIIGKRNVAIIAPAYRLSLIHDEPYPAGLNDCYDTLIWMKENAAELGIRDDKFIIAGHSGGGGMAAALTHKVVDTNAANIAFQMPIYPMMDHRQITESSKIAGTMVWDKNSNDLAWNNYLGHISGEIDEYASPALRTKFEGLPPTISFVGTMEPFKDEVINYMTSLKDAGVDTRFEVFDKCIHGTEILAPKSSVGMSMNNFQIDAFAEFYDKYI